jgi:ABC-type transport system involved in cytochrome c biogenesis permease subunit
VHLHDKTNNQKMNAKKIALAMIVISFMFLGMAFLTGCSVLGQPNVCIETQYGKFCYELPEIKGLQK